MDKHDIRRKAMAARECSHEVAPGVHITLRLPSRQEVAVAAARAGVHQPGNESAGLVVMQRELIQAAVVGWGAGVLLRHLLPDHKGSDAAQPLPFDADLVPLLLDAQPDWEDSLRERFVAERTARNARLEDAEKNLPSASPGNSTGAVHQTEIPQDPSEPTPASPSSTPASPGLFSA